MERSVGLWQVFLQGSGGESRTSCLSKPRIEIIADRAGWQILFWALEKVPCENHIVLTWACDLALRDSLTTSKKRDIT